MVWGWGRGESLKGRLISGRGLCGGWVGIFRESSWDKRGFIFVVIMIFLYYYLLELIL